MKIKITGKNADLLQEFLTSVINVACAIAWRGAENLYWNLDGDKYDLCPATNNYWAFVRERGDNFIVLEYDQYAVHSFFKGNKVNGNKF